MGSVPGGVYVLFGLDRALPGAILSEVGQVKKGLLNYCALFPIKVVVASFGKPEVLAASSCGTKVLERAGLWQDSGLCSDVLQVVNV